MNLLHHHTSRPIFLDILNHKERREYVSSNEYSNYNTSNNWNKKNYNE